MPYPNELSVALEAAEKSAAEISAAASEPSDYSRETAVVAAAIAPVVPETVEDAPKPDTTGHGG